MFRFTVCWIERFFFLQSNFLEIMVLKIFIRLKLDENIPLIYLFTIQVRNSFQTWIFDNYEFLFQDVKLFFSGNLQISTKNWLQWKIYPWNYVTCNLLWFLPYSEYKVCFINFFFRNWSFKKCIYNIVLFSCIQQSNSVIYIHISTLF